MTGEAAHPGGPLIELDGIELVVTAPVPTRILHPISLTVERGTSLAIIGPSGAGKTSLMTIIGLLQRPSAGSYRFGGTDISGLGRRAGARLRREHLGYVFQNANLIDERSAAENVELAFVGGRLSALERRQRSVGALEAVGLAPIADREAGLLSGGERQRVAVARALVKEPGLVLADEPTGALDRSTGAAVLQVLFDLAEQSGVTLLLVTHDQGAAAMAARTMSIVDGRIADG